LCSSRETDPDDRAEDDRAEDDRAETDRDAPAEGPAEDDRGAADPERGRERWERGAGMA
jgi:hypothetical protein